MKRMNAVKALFIASAIFISPPFLYGAGGERNVSIIDARGKVEILARGAALWADGLPGMRLGTGDTIRTGDISYADLEFGGPSAGSGPVPSLSRDGKAQAAVVRIGANSSLTIDTYIASDNIEYRSILLDLALGEILVKVNKVKDESQFRVRTPTSIVGVRGTMFKVQVE